MLHFASIGLSCLLLLGTFAAPCSIRTTGENEVTYSDSAVVYDDNVYAPLASSIQSFSIPYNSREFTKYDLAIFCPTYTFAPTVGSCAPIAASNIVGFYDRYDENLIPNHKSGNLVGSWYAYAIEDDAVESVIRELHSLMGTTATTGTTEKQFLDGLESFCKSKGKKMETYSCMSGKSFNFSKARSYIEDSNMPIALFLSGYNVGRRLSQENEDLLSFYTSDANHVMVGFGYSTYIYQTSDGTLTKNYFNVASGIAGNSSGIYDISLSTKINDALAIRIY